MLRKIISCCIEQETKEIRNRPKLTVKLIIIFSLINLVPCFVQFTIVYHSYFGTNGKLMSNVLTADTLIALFCYTQKVISR